MNIGGIRCKREQELKSSLFRKDIVRHEPLVKSLLFCFYYRLYHLYQVNIQAMPQEGSDTLADNAMQK